MSEIKVGDLVLILRGHCMHTRAGEVHTVKDVQVFHSAANCMACGKAYDMTGITAINVVSHLYLPASWVKRIPPLAELERAERTTELVV